MNNTFDYDRAKAYLRSGSRNDLLGAAGLQSGSTKVRFRFWRIVPAFGLSLLLALGIGWMLASDSSQPEMLLSEEAPPIRSAHEEAPDSVEKKTKKEKTLFLVAILSTVTVTLAAGSATIAPSPINLLILILFVTAATLNWTTYAKIRKERRN